MKKEEVLLAIALVLTLAPLASANTSPIIGEIDKEFVICESSAFSQHFEITDAEGGILDVSLSPSGPFFIKTDLSKAATTKAELYSNNLTKEQSNQIYYQTVYASDGQLIDSRDIKITVLEKNNPPEISYIGVQTVLLNGGASFEKQIFVNDTESGTQDSGNFVFEISSDLDLPMEIDKAGLIKFIPRQEDIGVHEIQICATDSGLANLENKLGICGEEDLRATSCIKFSLAVVEQNNPPTIILYNSTNSTRLISDLSELNFEIYKFDPDGIIPDTFWYADDKLKQINSGSAVDNFLYVFGCDLWGKHKIEARVTDGSLTDSVFWNFDLIKIPCAEGNFIGEKIDKTDCEENWGCYDWNLCQSLTQSEEIGLLSSQDKKKIEENCLNNGWAAGECGFQIRNCVDVNDCSAIKNKPLEIQECFFSANPSCSDKIKNCHNDECEPVPDCGGPCKNCQSCSDGIKNQEELGVDCGGPCFEECSAKTISETEKSVKQKILIIFVILIILALVQIVRIMKTKEELEKPFVKGGESRNVKK